MKTRAMYAVLLLSVVPLACDSPTEPPPVAVLLEATSGSGQTARVGVALGEPLVVRLRDAEGLPVPDVTVQWSVTYGGGTIETLAQRTDSRGMASAVWTLGPSVDSQTVRVSYGSLPPVDFIATATPGPIASITVLGSDQVALTRTFVADTIVVRVVDEFGNPVPGQSVQWNVPENSGTLVGASSATDSAGRARARWRLPEAPGFVVIRVAADTLEAEISAEARPVQIAKLGSGIGNHMCALDPEGRALCWGHARAASSAPGALPGVELDTCLEGTAAAQKCAKSPRIIAPQYRFSSIYVSASHVTCGITLESDTVCWGDGLNGPLGTGSTSQSAPPATLSTEEVFVTLTLGGNVACGLSAEGQAFCWGEGAAVGAGDAHGRLVPTQVETDVRFKQIVAAYYHVCAISLDDDLWCWGQGAGVTFDGSLSVPSRVIDGPFVDVAATHNATCALRADGTVLCWGAWQSERILAPRTGSYQTPREVVTNLRFRAITMGLSHICGLTQNDDTYCWGATEDGQAGVVSQTPPTSPVLLPFKFTEVNSLVWSNCGRTQEGQTYCWGNNDYGQLGVGTDTGSASPLRVDQ